MSIQDELPDTVLFVGEKGEISVTDQDLAPLHSYNPEQESQTVDSFVFSRSEAVFAPRRLALRDGAVIVSVQKSHESISIRLAGIDRSGITILGDIALPPKLVSTSPKPPSQHDLIQFRLCSEHHAVRPASSLS